MSWFVPAFEVLLQVTVAGFALTAVASLTVLLLREPARKIRVIQLALLGLLVLPALALLPGYPRVTWWTVVDETVGDIELVSLLTKSPPAKPEAATPVQPVAPPASKLPTDTQPPALPGGSSSTPSVGPTAPVAVEPPLPTTPHAAAAPSVVPQPTPPINAVPPIVVSTTRQPTTPAPHRTAQPAAAAPRKPAGFVFPALPDVRLLAVSAYLFGVAVLALWWFVGRVAMWRLMRTATPAEPHVRALLAGIIESQRAGLAARVRLLVSPRAAQPCAFGWLRPTIVLPERVVRELTPQQLRLALSHEWSHVARGDIRTWTLAGVVRLVHFHQPLAWLLRRELRISQDYLADAAAAGHSTPEDYAELLTTLSRMLRPTPLSPGLGIAPRKSDLYRRVVMLVDQSRPLERTIPRRWNLAAIALGLALIAGAATLRAEPEADKAPLDDQPQNASSDSAPVEQNILSSAERKEKTASLTKLKQEQFSQEIARLNATELGMALGQLRTELASHLANPGTPRDLITSIERQIVQLEHAIAIRQPEQGRIDNATPVEPLAARPKTRDELLNDPTDRRDVALELVTVGRQLESLLKTRKGLQLRLSKAEHTAQERQQLEQVLAGIDDSIADASQRMVTIQAHFDEASLKDFAQAQAAVADWDKAGEKRQLLEASLAELDQLLKTRYHMFKQAAQLTSSKDRASFEAQMRIIDTKRVEIAQRIDELLQPRATRSVAAARTENPDEGLGIQPELLAKAILHNEPQYVEFQKELSKRQLQLSEQRSSGAAREVLDKSQRSVLQLEEHIEEWKAARMPALLELVTAYSALDGQRRAATERGGRAATESQGRATSGTAPFSGRIRPGDILNIEIVGGFPTPPPPPRTVEPDGRIVVSPEYSTERCKLAGLTLTEAGEAIAKLIRPVLEKEPKVLVTYAGHDDGIVAEGQSALPRAALTSRKEPAPPRSAPFSGRIRPGDILGIEIVGGFPAKQPPTRTVEPDGNLPLGPIYGPVNRVQVGGLTLIEAGQAIEKQLKSVLKDPHVLLTYQGHDDGIIATGAVAGATAPTDKRVNSNAGVVGSIRPEPVVLQPLDTIEIILPLKRVRTYISEMSGKSGEVLAGTNPAVSGTYVIEPDGRVALPEAGGRINLAGLSAEEAGQQLREHLSVHLFPRIALPSVSVLRRGRAVFPDGKQPAADYKIAPGDTVLWGTSNPLGPTVVNPEGNVTAGHWSPVGEVRTVHLAGLTLEEAQAALRKTLTYQGGGSGGGFAGGGTDQVPPWVITLGGWREEADPRVIDLIEGNDATQLLRMQEEMQELKSMIRRLHAE